MAPPIPLMLPPGLVRGKRSNFSTKGRYVEASHMRWIVEGNVVTLRPMKGWAYSSFNPGTPLAYAPRGAHAWVDNDEVPYFMVGTHGSLHARDGSAMDDITPSGFTAGSAHVGTWTFDNMGEVGIACFDTDGRILEYQPGGGGNATVVTNAPTAKATFVTDEKFLFALHINGDPRAYAWSSQDARTIWTPTALNSAGDLPINEVGTIMCGSKIKGGALIWTTTGVYFLEFIGRPDIYGSERAGNSCGIISRNAKCVFGSSAYWMGTNKFFTFKGYTRPLECDIGDYVFGNINTTYAHKVWAHHRPSHNEIWFAYPHGAATECSHAAIYNYEKDYWNHTPFARAAGFDDEVFGVTMAFSSGGRVFDQETGWTYADPGDAEVLPFARSGPVDMDSGERRMQIDEFWPDEENQGSVDTYFHLREFANSTEYTIGPFSSADRVGVFSTARLAAIEYRAKGATEDFRVGTWMAQIGPRRGRH